MDRKPAGEDIEAHTIEFTGSGGEFFRVWIVNLLLTIVTLGFYTPFARRRTAQYFYGHTRVANSPLEFTAQQRKMVFGFLILAGFYLAFQVAAETGQDMAVSLLMLGAATLAPYLWGSAMRFRLGSTRWRGVRLQFTAQWTEIYKASWPVFALALVWMVTVWLISLMAPDAPDAAGLPTLTLALAGLVGVALVLSVLCIIRMEFNFKSLLVKRARIGNQAGRWKPVYGDFVRIWLATVAVLLLCVALTAAVVAVLVGGSLALFAGLQDRGPLAVVMGFALFILLVFVLFLASAPARAYREARLFRLVWNNVGLSHVARCKCTLKTRAYILLRIKNLLLTLLTLGFYRPFSMVSEYRMKVESVTVHIKGGVDQLAGQLVTQQGGLGDAVADAVGLDVVG